MAPGRHPGDPPGPIRGCLRRDQAAELLLAAQTANRGAEVGLDAVRLLEALAKQPFGERPVLGTTCRGEVDLEPGCELSVFWQGGDVDELLDPRKGDLVERCDPAGERIDETLDVRVRDDPVHVAVLGGQRGRDVVAAEQDLQGPAAADEPAQARHGSAAGNGADADLELTQDRRLGGETDIGGEDEIVATGSLLSRTKLSKYGCRPVGPGRIDATRALSDRKSQWAMK